MAKEKVYIVLSHVNQYQHKSNQWEVVEKVEFVNSLRTRHYTTASVVADYINSKIIVGNRVGFHDYSQLDGYVRSKYPNQMKEIDNAYGDMRVQVDVPEAEMTLIVDNFGVTRAKTIFDQ